MLLGVNVGVIPASKCIEARNAFKQLISNRTTASPPLVGGGRISLVPEF